MAEHLESEGVSQETTEEQEETYPVQSETDQKICDKIFEKFLIWRDNRNRNFEYFGYKNCYDYWDDSNKRFNNYRIKPAWKEEWQSNISDITTHAKLMAIVAQQVVNRYKPVFNPRFSRDIVSKLLSQIIQDIYDYTDTDLRNGELDTLFAVLRGAREGTVIGFEGYKKTALFEGIDAQFVPLEDFYPAEMTKFDMVGDNGQLAAIWRTVMSKGNFDEKYRNWYQWEKVRTREQANSNDQRSFFNISNDIQGDQVEILRYFDRLNDEFFVSANGILIINPNRQGWKLSDRRKDKELGFWKTVFEAFDNFFFYGRSLPHLMKDNQDAIDFLFEAMFDKEILAVMRPILIGGPNQPIEDYNYPGRQVKYMDINQIKEMPISPPDLTAFRVLKELKDRQHFISVDEVSQGVATGRKTATEVQRAQEAAIRLNSVLGVLIKDAVVQKAKLRSAIIQQYLIRSEKFKQFVRENVQLMSGGRGTRLIRLTQQPSPAQPTGFSPQLAAENQLIPTESEIIEIKPEKIADFELSITTKAPSTIEVNPALRKALDLQWARDAFNLPDVYDRQAVGKIHAEASDKDWEEVRAKEAPPMLEGQGQTTKGDLIPSLKALINQTQPNV